MSTDRTRVERIIQYVVQESDDFERFGHTKLNKILWWADREHRRRYGRTITGAAYRRKPNGPVLDQFYDVIDGLKRAHVLAETTPRVYDFVERRLVSVAPERVELTELDPSEKSMLRASIDRHRRLSAIESSDLSHEDLGWKIVEDEQIIPESYFELTWEPLSDEDKEAIRQKAPLTAADFARFRSETEA